VASLRDELRRCAVLGLPYLVVHPGSHVGSGEQTGLRRVVRALDRSLVARDGREEPVSLLLETTAGQGSNLGHRFEQLAWILDRAGASERLGICFDTCHALAAGYRFGDRRSFGDTFDALDRAIGLGRLKALHLNDSKHGAGSRRDRHEHIGRGRIGLEGFRLILNDPRLRDLPMVLETPKGEDLEEDRENLATLRSLIPRARR
jgi:deoxyribonuclease-4